MPEEVFFLSIFTIIGSTILLFPLVRALAERIRPRGVEAGLKDEIQMLRDDMLTEVQQARHEIAELGERMDFAERLLAKRVES